MKSFERFTTQYIPLEDRIQLGGEMKDGTTETIWLTQRLLLGVLPALIHWLEKQSPTPQSSDIVLSFQQQAAKAALKPQKPVQVDAGSTAWVAAAADIASGGSNLLLTFKSSSQHMVHLALTAQQLRQWLGIVHKGWRQAGWPRQVWPEWFSEATATQHNQLTLLH